jgi:hypothetical protein
VKSGRYGRGCEDFKIEAGEIGEEEYVPRSVRVGGIF